MIHCDATHLNYPSLKDTQAINLFHVYSRELHQQEDSPYALISRFSLQPNFDKSTQEKNNLSHIFFTFVYRVEKMFWIAESPYQRTGTTVSCGSLTRYCTITAISQLRCGEQCLRTPRITITIWRRVWRVALALSSADCSLWKIWPWLAFRMALYSSSTL